MRPRVPALSSRMPGLLPQLETIVSILPPAQSVEVGDKEEMVSREHLSQIPLSEFRFLDSSYSRH